MSFLIRTGLTGVPAAWSMWWRKCFHTRCFYFIYLFLPLCNEPHCFSFRFLSWFIATSYIYIYFFFPTGHSTIHHFTLLSWHLLCCIFRKTRNMIFYHYSGNIYTTLSKLHLAGNMFQRLSTPHGVAGGLTSIKRSAAKIGRRNEGNGFSW